MNLRSIFLPACLALCACSSETTVQGSGGAGSGGVSGGGGSPTGGGSGGVGATGGGGTAGSATGGTAGSLPTGGGTGGTGGTDCDAGPIPCGVEVVAEGTSNTWGLLLRGTDVYFTSSSAVLSCPKTGCGGSKTIVAGNQNSPRHLALRSGSPDRLFWTNKDSSSGALMRCDLSPSCGAPTPIATSVNAPDHLAVSATYAFFSDATNTITRCDESATPKCTGIFPATAPVGGIVYANDRVYWSVPSLNKIDACLTNDCALPTGKLLYPAGPGVNAMAVGANGSELYWVHNLSPGPLKKCPTAGCSHSGTVLNQNAAVYPTSIATDGSDIYILQADGAIVSCAVNGCSTPTPRMAPFGSGGTIAVDGTHMYWTVPDKGYVLRKSKL